MLLRSVGRAAGKAREGDELTPVLIREQHLPWWHGKNSALACSGLLIFMQGCVPCLYWNITALNVRVR